jgi:NAD(P)-dependent dehydrogenase (short-subunit alcohol dehydrogenase family)
MFFMSPAWIQADDVFSVNSKAAFLILQEGAKNVQDGGKIITIVTSLLAAFTGLYTAYAGSKALSNTSLEARRRSSPVDASASTPSHLV